ncbi:hypothetical protein VNO77_24527 [Canavalia gladiata]|uniref:Uncharacterized protein n=1 Tax=Canavalia gladiata TaxID=3824 RepID=A0AAN9L8Z0_CANGL
MCTLIIWSSNKLLPGLFASSNEMIRPTELFQKVGGLGFRFLKLHIFTGLNGKFPAKLKQFGSAKDANAGNFVSFRRILELIER